MTSPATPCSSSSTRPGIGRRAARLILGLVVVVAAWKGVATRFLHRHQFYDPRSASAAGPVPAESAPRLEATIMSLAGNGTGERNVYRPVALNAAAGYLVEQFTKLGYPISPRAETEPHLEFHPIPVPTEYAFGATDFSPSATNIIAEIPGTTRRDEVIIVGAHYDTVAFSKDWTGDATNQFRVQHTGTPGANDNASGVAALLELAGLLKDKRPARTLRFVAFANEEPPFFQEKNAMGSWLYAQRCRAQNQNILMMISLDTVGVYTRRDANLKRSWPASWLLGLLGLGSGTDYVAFMSNWEVESGWHAARWARVFARHSPVAVRTVSLPFIPRFGKEVFAWSDDWSFTRESYPAFTVTDTAFYRSDRYHELGDSPAQLTRHDYETLAGVVRGLAGMLETMANADDTAPAAPPGAGVGWFSLAGVAWVARRLLGRRPSCS